MTPTAPAAPAAAPAAADSSAPAAPAAVSTSGGSLFDHLALAEKPIIQEPGMDQPLGSPFAAPEQQKSTEAGTQPETESKPAVAKTGEENPSTEVKPKADEPGRMYADRFKTVEHLEVAYKQSSQQGRRLAKEVETRGVELEKAQSKIKELEAQVALGPETKEPTDDELKAMDPIAAAKALNRYSDQKRTREALAEKRSAEERQAKQSSEALYNEVVGRARSMAQDKEKYPDYGELEGIMSEFLDYEPSIAGHRGTPLVLYFAAKGLKSAQADVAARKASKASTDTAKVKAAADAAAAGGTGPAGSEKTPAGTERKLDPNSDEAHNMALLRGGKPKPVFSL